MTRRQDAQPVSKAGSGAVPVKKGAGGNRPARQARPFVGRDAELARMTQWLGVLDPDAPAPVLLIVGEPGVGKSALLERGLQNLDATVVWTTGDEAEAALDYGLLDQIARQPWPVTAPAAWSEAAPATPLGTAGRDPLDVGAEFLRAVDELPPDRPLIVVVDDAQVADTPSLQALTFAARRLCGDRFALVLATRPEGLKRLPAGLLRLAERRDTIQRLSGLEPEDLRRLAEAIGHRGVADETVARLHALTDGHPLHASILLEQGGVEAWPRDGAVPALPSLGTLVSQRLVACSAPARRLLEALAVLDGPFAVGAVAQLGGVDEPLAAVDELCDLGLIQVDAAISAGAVAAGANEGMTVAFRHALIRAAIYAELPIGRRTRLHGLAASLVRGEESLRHRVASALGPDAGLARELARQAERDAARGARHAAARHFYRAAEFASDAGARERYALLGAGQLLSAGQPLGAKLGEIERFGDGALRSAVLGSARMAEGRLGEARPLLERAWMQREQNAGEDPLPPQALAAIAEHLGVIAISRLDADAVLLWAQRVGATGAPTLAATLACHGLALRGDLAAARERAAVQVAAERPGPTSADARLGRGIIHLWSNDLDAAQRDLISILGEPVEHAFIQAVVARSHLADVHLRAGRLLEAADLAEVAIGLLDDAQAVWLMPLPHSIAAYAYAAAGDFERARRHAEVAGAYAEATRDAPATIWAEGAWLRIADAEEDPAAAVAAGDRMLAAGLGTVAEGINHWRSAYAEALVAVGRLADAERVLQQLDADLRSNGDVSAATGAARARAAWAAAGGDAAGAEQAFQSGLELDAALARPLPRARLELAAGGFLRRLGRRTDAAACLRSAARRLREIGARPWLARCQQELAACGLRPVQRSRPDAAAALTPQERVIARLVAEGRTNRQVAAELYVSVKTVEHHLSHVYAKLGVRNRTEMASTLARMQSGVTGPSSAAAARESAFPPRKP